MFSDPSMTSKKRMSSNPVGQRHLLKGERNSTTAPRSHHYPRYLLTLLLTEGRAAHLPASPWFVKVSPQPDTYPVHVLACPSQQSCPAEQEPRQDSCSQQGMGGSGNPWTTTQHCCWRSSALLGLVGTTLQSPRSSPSTLHLLSSYSGHIETSRKIFSHIHVIM